MSLDPTRPERPAESALDRWLRERPMRRLTVMRVPTGAYVVEAQELGENWTPTTVSAAVGVTQVEAMERLERALAEAQRRAA